MSVSAAASVPSDESSCGSFDVAADTWHAAASAAAGWICCRESEPSESADECPVQSQQTSVIVDPPHVLAGLG